MHSVSTRTITIQYCTLTMTTILFFIIIYAVEFIGWVIQKTIYRSDNTPPNHSNNILGILFHIEYYSGKKNRGKRINCRSPSRLTSVGGLPVNIVSYYSLPVDFIHTDSSVARSVTPYKTSIIKYQYNYTLWTQTDHSPQFTSSCWQLLSVSANGVTSYTWYYINVMIIVVLTFNLKKRHCERTTINAIK